MLSNFFRLEEHQTTASKEVLAGLTTFLTMAYILFVQPAVLSRDFAGNPTGLDAGAVLLATCVSAAAATLIMGLYARYPIALAPGMGQNFFFVTVVMSLTSTYGESAWKVALGIVLVAGLLFLALSLLGVREAILNALSPSLRNSIAVGIGMFIAFIGLQKATLITGSPGTLVQLNPDLWTADVAVFAAGFIATAALQARGFAVAVLVGIGASALVAATMGKIELPTAWVGFPEISQSAVLVADVRQALSAVCLPYVFVFLFMDLFDTMGTLVGVAEQAGFVKDDQLPRAKQALTADAAGTVLGACLGTSTVTSYIESAAGVQQGGRTGLVSVTVAGLFLLALAFSPILALVGEYPPVTAAALLTVGATMCRNVTKIRWDDPSEAFPSFLVIVGIPLSFSIADGLSLGVISYVFIKLLSGKWREIGWVMCLLAVVLIIYFSTVRTQLIGN